jgi:hypothetical protein
MRNILIVLAAIFIASCSLSHDKLYLYKNGFIPCDAKNIRFDGYYSLSKDEFFAHELERCPQSVAPIFFYPDGSVSRGIQYCSEDQMTRMFDRNQLSLWNWGTYTCEGNSVVIEALWPNSGTMNVDRFYLVGNVTKETLMIFLEIDRDGVLRKRHENYYFVESEIRPKLENNPIKTMDLYNE